MDNFHKTEAILRKDYLQDESSDEEESSEDELIQPEEKPQEQSSGEQSCDESSEEELKCQPAPPAPVTAIAMRAEAKQLGLKGYSKMNKSQLEVLLAKKPAPVPEVVAAPVDVDPKLAKLTLADLRVLSKKVGIKLSYYNKLKGKSVAKPRARLIADITAYCNNVSQHNCPN